MKGIKEIGSYDNPEEIGYTEWCKVIGTGGARDMLKERLNCKQSELFHFMGETRNTLTEVKERLSAVERRVENLERVAIVRAGSSGIEGKGTPVTAEPMIKP